MSGEVIVVDVVRIVRFPSLVGVLVLLSIGCGGPGEVEAGPESSATEVSATPPAEDGSVGDTGRPPAEGSGPESPQPRGEGRPAIPIPSLPIGGDTVQPADRAPVCATASWLGTVIPPGVSVSVTAVQIDPAYFATSRSGCAGGNPQCTDAFVFTADHRSCDVAVIATGPPAETASLFLVGTARCPSDQRGYCAGLAEDGKDMDDNVALVTPSEPVEEAAPTDSSSPSPPGWVG
jgi:hypothetical protein